MSALAAEETGKLCSVCGELAGNPLFTAFFVGVGVRELSMEPKLIPTVKKLIRNITVDESKKFAREVLKIHRTEEIRALLKRFYDSHR
jgi:phosphotransferase system enzyme I (PtsI)